MSILNTDKFLKVAPNTGWRLDSSGISDASVTSFGLDSASGLPTDTAVMLTVRRVDASGNKTPAFMERIVGIVSGNSIVSCIRGVEGTAQKHPGGSVVEIVIASEYWNRVISGILAEHNADGTHKLDTDGTLASNSDTKIASQKAVKTYADTGTQTMTNKTLTSPVFGNNIQFNLNGVSNQREESNIKRWSGITSAITVLRLTLGSTSGDYGNLYFEISVGGIGNGQGSGACRASFLATVNAGTVSISQIGSTSTIGSSAPVLTTYVSGHETGVNIAKAAGATSFDGTVFSKVQILDGDNVTYTISYS